MKEVIERHKEYVESFNAKKRNLDISAEWISDKCNTLFDEYLRSCSYSIHAGNGGLPLSKKRDKNEIVLNLWGSELVFHCDYSCLKGEIKNVYLIAIIWI